MDDGDRPRYDKLDDADRRRRPETVRRLTFEELAAPGPTFRDTRYLVPIESVEAGDAQVLAARSARFGEPIIDLDPLAAFPTVRSTSRPRSFEREHRFRTFPSCCCSAILRFQTSRRCGISRDSFAYGPAGRQGSRGSRSKRCPKGSKLSASAGTVSGGGNRRRRDSPT